MRRRDFLKNVGVGAAGLATAGGLALPRSARGSTAVWGDYPDYALPGLLPEGQRAKNVLEIFLYGGLAPWETLYVVDDPAYGQAQGYMWFSYLNEVTQRYNQCYGSGAPSMLENFVVDENGAQVKLGPFVLPLRQRNDVKERLRLHVISHTLEPHEAAIPLAMSGYRLGSPKLAGVGAAVQHYHLAHEGFSGEPYSYVLYSPGDFPTDNLRAASSVGLHPGSSRPLSINVTASTAFIDALSRNQVGNLRPEFDALLSHYAEQYRQQLTFPGAGAAVRSNTMADYDFAIGTMQNTDQLTNILDESYFQAVGGSHCGQSNNPNYPNMGLRLATHLLTRPDSKAKHITVVDGGLIPASGGGGYDTHSNHVNDSARNLKNVLEELLSRINEPGENDPDKLNLDETLVVLNMEFGRTPWKQGSSGRNHHPYAYVTAMFGGPVGPEQQGLVGAIGSDGFATTALSPAETRAASLAALGVYPFAAENYAVSDVFGAGDETEAALWLKEEVLGVKS